MQLESASRVKKSSTTSVNHVHFYVFRLCASVRSNNAILNGAEWWYGPVLCKAAPYLQGVAVGASVNTLVAVAIERSVLELEHKFSIHTIFCLSFDVLEFQHPSR